MPPCDESCASVLGGSRNRRAAILDSQSIPQQFCARRCASGMMGGKKCKAANAICSLTRWDGSATGESALSH